jgi:hypothetical protein
MRRQEHDKEEVDIYAKGNPILIRTTLDGARIYKKSLKRGRVGVASTLKDEEP